ncbi:hypothetical protein M378DRAFT_764549 [Amanita muscaria Koide BX008]|uniref:SHSP domain-containing protein n=1 Tax=Amanita muscaria (strain Koide BX008) TaxID=946122 RepID=A0A0C2XI04_AMAMK|nr:hypothetical protein M378DRAFT_764549 [Amanita muscaria Koide BX008]
MTSLFWDPFSDFDRFFGDPFFDERWYADRLLPDTDWGRRPRRGDRTGRALTRGGGAGAGDTALTLRPRMDLHEQSDKNTVTAIFELPGLTKDNVNIHVSDGRLEISGESKYSDEYEDGNFTVRERQVGKIYRSIPLPQGVTDKDVKANFDNGVLSVTFPKTTEETAPKRITVS